MNYVRMAIRILVVLVFVGVAAAGCDFVNFVGRADKAVTPAQPDHAEGVTALTGASNARIVVGVQLATSLQLPLLISGVHVDTSTADIAKIVELIGHSQLVAGLLKGGECLLIHQPRTRCVALIFEGDSRRADRTGHSFLIVGGGVNLLDFGRGLHGFIGATKIGERPSLAAASLGIK